MLARFIGDEMRANVNGILIYLCTERNCVELNASVLCDCLYHVGSCVCVFCVCVCVLGVCVCVCVFVCVNEGNEPFV